MIPSEYGKMNPWRLLLLIGGGAFLGLGCLLTLTNPGNQQYEDFATKQLVIYLKENICQPSSADLGEAIKSQMCHLMVDTGKQQIPKLIAQTTQRHNYLLFSTYQTELYLYSFDTIGILNHFYVIDVDKIYDGE